MKPGHERGTLIAVEGLDGAGKRTQCELLAEALGAQGRRAEIISFPQYQGSLHGELIGRYLNGDFGPPGSVPPEFTALCFAGDRFEARARIRDLVVEGCVVIADRYVGSNIIYQGARVDEADLDRFAAWVERLEYEVLGIPREELVVYLRIPPDLSSRLVARKAPRAHLDGARDIYEKDRGFQEAVLRRLESVAAGRQRWRPVECVDAEGGLLSPAVISSRVVAVVRTLLDR